MGDDAVDVWSGVAAAWAERWGGFAAPAATALLDAAAVGRGSRLLDVGCGSGELLRAAADRGATVAGCDPAPAMLALAASRAPGADLRVAGGEGLPWADAAFDVVTAVNALHLADDVEVALAEARRVLVPGGVLAVAQWAERAANDVAVLELAAEAADGEAPSAEPPGRGPGGLEALLELGGFAVAASGSVEVPWSAAGDEDLVAGVLLGEDPSVLADLGPAVVAAAAPFRVAGGGYRLRNRFRWVVAGA